MRYSEMHILMSSYSYIQNSTLMKCIMMNAYFLFILTELLIPTNRRWRSNM